MDVIMNTDYVTLWVCIDCRDDDDNDNAWTAIHPDDQHRDITPGLMVDEHYDDCPNIDADGEWTGDTDEPCETQDFSWSPCDGCGSHLGGHRFAYTMHLT